MDRPSKLVAIKGLLSSHQATNGLLWNAPILVLIDWWRPHIHSPWETYSAYLSGSPPTPCSIVTRTISSAYWSHHNLRRGRVQVGRRHGWWSYTVVNWLKTKLAKEPLSCPPNRGFIGSLEYFTLEGSNSMGIHFCMKFTEHRITTHYSRCVYPYHWEQFTGDFLLDNHIFIKDGLSLQGKRNLSI